MNEIWTKIVDFFKSIIDSLFAILNDVFCSIVDALLKAANSILNTVNLGLSYLDITTYFNGLPADVLNVMGLIGISECSVMIVSSLGIRLILQLIPFTRLGS